MYYCLKFGLLKIFLFIFFSFVSFAGITQDTLRVTLLQAEKRFLEKNLLLLASTYQVGVAEAQVIQARLWENPNLSIDFNAIDPDNKKVLHTGRTGQKAIAADQLIYLGGKKKNEVALATAHVQVAQFELQDLLRNLKFNMRTAFYDCYFDLITINKYNRQIQQLQAIITAYEEQAAKGNVSLREAVRLKATQLQIYNDRSDLQKNISRQQQLLQVLLDTTAFIDPDLPLWEGKTDLDGLLLDSLTSTALQWRTDMKVAEAQWNADRLNINYQKSLGVPDLRLGAAYDQRGGAFNNQINITASIGLPVLHRNQGNIQAAKQQALSSKTLIAQKQVEIQAEVQACYRNLLQAVRDFNRVQEAFQQSFDALNEGIFLNFQKGNISLLEFTDFVESYNQMITEYNRIQKNRITAYETVNYVVSRDIF